MSACIKNTSIPLLDAANILVRKIRFTSDRKTIELILLGLSTTVECTNDIDSGAYLGIKIEGNDLVFTDAIDGLSRNLSSAVADNPVVSIVKVGDGLNFIGIDDVTMSFSATKMNVRYDAISNSVKFQL